MFQFNTKKQLSQVFEKSFSIIVENNTNEHQQISILNPSDFLLGRTIKNDNISIRLLDGDYEKFLLQIFTNPILCDGLLYQVLNAESQFDNIIKFSYSDEVFGKQDHTLTPVAYMVEKELFKQINLTTGHDENTPQRAIRSHDFKYEICSSSDVIVNIEAKESIMLTFGIDKVLQPSRLLYGVESVKSCKPQNDTVMENNNIRIQLELSNQMPKQQIIRLLNFKEFTTKDIEDFIPGNSFATGCKVKAIGPTEYKDILPKLSGKYKLVGVSAFGDLLQFTHPWAFGFNNLEGASMRQLYYPLEDINDHLTIIRTKNIVMDIIEDSFLEIPVIGTDERAGGGRIVILLELQPTFQEIRETEPKELHIDLSSANSNENEKL